MNRKHCLPDEGFCKLPQVLEAIPVSKSTWFRGIAAGKYPPPVKIGTRASAWRVEEIRRCIATLTTDSEQVRRTPSASFEKKRPA